MKPLLAFFIACFAGAFSFWIGGGEPFTMVAGMVSITTISVATFVYLAVKGV